MPIGIGLLGLVFLGGLFVLLGVGVALLFRRGTWPIGLVLIGFPLVMVLLGIGLFTVRTVSYHNSAVSRQPGFVEMSVDTRADEIRRTQQAKAEVLRQQLERGRIRIEKAQERIAKSHTKQRSDRPKPAEVRAVEELKPDATPDAEPDKAKPAEIKQEKAKPAADAEETASETAEEAPLENASTDEPEAATVPVNSVTTFGLIVRALAAAIDSELPRNISGDEAMTALEETVNDELPAEASKSSLISSLGKAIGRAVAQKHEEISLTGDGEDQSRANVPAWVDQPSETVNGVYRTVVKVGPFSTDLECKNALPSALDMAVNDYVGLLVNNPEARTAGVSLPRERLEELVVAEKYQQRIQSSVGPMVQLHALVEFDTKVQEMLRDEWKNVQIRERLLVAGLAFGSVLLLIAAAYGFLRLDLATEGKARGRILLAVITIAVLLGIFVPRIVSNLDDRGTLDGATDDLFSVSTVSETAPRTAVSAAPASWAGVALTALFIVSVVLCFRTGTRKWGIALLIFCGILFGTGLFLLSGQSSDEARISHTGHYQVVIEPATGPR